MRTKALTFLFLSCCVLGSASWFGAQWAVQTLERDTKDKVLMSLNAAGETWADIETDGLIVRLQGEAPSETGRFRALELTAKIVDTNRIEDLTSIKTAGADQVPDFMVEIIRNGRDLTLSGLVPGKNSRLELLQQIEPIRTEGQFTNLLESLEFEAPDGWRDALDFAIRTAVNLPKTRLMVRPGGVTIEAFFTNQPELRETKKAIEADTPEGVELALLFSAPKVVVAPFRFKASMKDGVLDVMECWADDQVSQGAIYTALSDLGSEADCPEALGAPTPEWGASVVSSIKALTEAGSGSITMTDMDITFEGSEGASQSDFETAASSLEQAIPEFFSLKLNPPAQMVAPEPRNNQPPILEAIMSADGSVQISGPMRDSTSKTVTENFANARFGNVDVKTSLAVRGNVPAGWSPRVLSALDALSLLHDGSANLTMETLTIDGRSPQEDMSKLVIETLSGQIPAEQLSITIAHDPELAKVAEGTSVNDRECERQLAGILREAQIVFDPNSSTISGESEILLDEIGFIITSCPEAQFEIGGHTDSQGGDGMNLSLSQARADAVLDSLLVRDVLLDQLTAKGYGETEPIADNETEDGRTRNRRIAFKLLDQSEDENEQN